MEASSTSNKPGDVVLAPMLQPSDIWSDADNWTGVTSAKERKKRQNRINQRAYRRRRAQPSVQEQLSSTSSLPSEPTDDSPKQNQPKSPQVDPYGAQQNGPSLISCPRRKARAQDLIKQAYEDYSLRLEAGRRTNLHIVVRLNVLNALARNAVVMGFAAEGLCHDAFVSPYCQLGPGLWPLTYISSTPSVPGNLQSTDVQRSTPHHPWIDLFPFPRFRDNMIHALSVGSIDEDELCLDMVEIDGPLHQLDKKPSIMVWGESWDMRSWEASVPFLMKWGWLLRGCDELIQSTNLWRQKRGEKKLVFNCSW